MRGFEFKLLIIRKFPQDLRTCNPIGNVKIFYSSPGMELATL